VSKLVGPSTSSVSFVGQFGNDLVATGVLQNVLRNHGVEISNAGGVSTTVPSGRGYVFLSSSTGQVSAVVSGGSNQRGWEPTWPKAWEQSHHSSSGGGGKVFSSKDDVDDHANNNKDDDSSAVDALNSAIDELLNDCSLIMLQREVPEYVNQIISCKAKEKINNGRGIVILQDVGGEDRPIDAEHLQNCDYLMPNESELRRLVASLEKEKVGLQKVESDDDDDDSIVALCHIMQKHGARNVLVTRGSRGSTLVSQDSKNVIHQPPVLSHQCDGNKVVDETGAGDCYRAAFAVALLERESLLPNKQMKSHKLTTTSDWILGHRQCMEFASAAGSLAVETMGAVPSTPTRDQVEERLRLWKESMANGNVGQQSVLEIPRGDGQRGREDVERGAEDFPFLIGSRLNSMKDRAELWDGPLAGPLDYVKRQAAIQGLTCVDFNYPQHFDTTRMAESVADAKKALEDANLVAGAVCLRYPGRFARGAMNHPDAALRREVIELTKQAAQVALDLGCREVVVWSAFDGYDYPFQVDYDATWAQLVSAFQECCDSFPSIKFSVEFKPTGTCARHDERQGRWEKAHLYEKLLTCFRVGNRREYTIFYHSQHRCRPFNGGRGRSKKLWIDVGRWAYAHGR
jgi:sugar/nucleoside kinase (ribokinase family)